MYDVPLQNGSFFSILGFESWILSILCVGMAPWNNFFISLLQIVLMGPLRLIGLFIQSNFDSVVKKCAKQKITKKDN